MKSELSRGRQRIVWHLCSNRWNSAITEYALSCAQAMALRGWRSFYSARLASPGLARAQALGLEGPQFKNFGAAELPKFWRAAGEIKPDLIILYGGPETFLARFIGGVPRIRFRGQDSDAQKDLAPFRTQWGMSHCSAILTPAAFLQKRFQAVLGAKKPVHAVTLGISRERFAFNAHALSQARRPTLRILGRLDPVKGQREFFSVYRRLLALWPSALPAPWLEIVGLPANLKAEDIRAAAAAEGLVEGRDWGLLIERVADMRNLLSATHLGIIPSLGSEIICRVAEEFLLAGCPIAVSGVGSLAECLFNEEAGFSWKGLGAEQQAEILKNRLLVSFQESQDHKAERALGAAARFSLEAMGTELDAVLSRYLK